MIQAFLLSGVITDILSKSAGPSYCKLHYKVLTQPVRNLYRPYQEVTDPAPCITASDVRNIVILTAPDIGNWRIFSEMSQMNKVTNQMRAFGLLGWWSFFVCLLVGQFYK